METFINDFNADVFTEDVMKARLPEEIFSEYKRSIDTFTPIKKDVADAIALEMKRWAIEKGATHYTHWFQPMTGVTAEKHDSFLSRTKNGKPVSEFSGSTLIKGEPDASSFPTGGIRATFEARGYTTWDPTSYAFITDNVLCIPTAFCSYGGEALDLKTPLLRSLHALNDSAKRVLKLFGQNPAHVSSSVGAEQEYFLIDKEVYEARPDIVATGRTLLGARPSKGQELDDHYFGKIKTRVSDYMHELNRRLWRLGVSAKTEHNEVAPAQHELACIYEDATLACDHNQIVMAMMKQLAPKFGMVCLLHEKPFEGINGSGKHNNWSIAADGDNLLDADGDVSNLRFLAFLTAVIKAVDEYQDLLRISVASASNDHRLGANEAPPAIVSVFLGDEITEQLDGMIEKGTGKKAKKCTLNTGVGALPEIKTDSTDRNRTSPFAFTGNKFEFRMPGSRQSISQPNTVLNTIVAKTLDDLADYVEGKKDTLKTVEEYIKLTYENHKRIVFNGNNYSDEWKEEAGRRGLCNYRTTADAVVHLTDGKNIELFEKYGVYSERELVALREIMLENYVKTVHIEAVELANEAMSYSLPDAIGYKLEIAREATKTEALSISCNAEKALLKELSKLTDKLYDKCGELKKEIANCDALSSAEDKANAVAGKVLPAMEALRACADETEKLLGRKYITLPTYGEILSSVKY